MSPETRRGVLLLRDQLVREFEAAKLPLLVYAVNRTAADLLEWETVVDDDESIVGPGLGDTKVGVNL